MGALVGAVSLGTAGFFGGKAINDTMNKKRDAKLDSINKPLPREPIKITRLSEDEMVGNVSFSAPTKNYFPENADVNRYLCELASHLAVHENAESTNDPLNKLVELLRELDLWRSLAEEVNYNKKTDVKFELQDKIHVEKLSESAIQILQLDVQKPFQHDPSLNKTISQLIMHINKSVVWVLNTIQRAISPR